MLRLEGRTSIRGTESEYPMAALRSRRRANGKRRPQSAPGAQPKLDATVVESKRDMERSQARGLGNDCGEDVSRKGQTTPTQIARRAANDDRAQAAGAGEPLSMLCECMVADCSARIQLPPETYERVRAEPTCFVVAVGHEDSSIERPVERHPSFSVVQKRTDKAKRIATETDPRHPSLCERHPQWARLSRDPARTEIGGKVVGAFQRAFLRIALKGDGIVEVPLPGSFQTIPELGAPVLVYFDPQGGVLGWYLPDERRGVDLRKGVHS